MCVIKDEQTFKLTTRKMHNNTFTACDYKIPDALQPLNVTPGPLIP